VKTLAEVIPVENSVLQLKMKLRMWRLGEHIRSNPMKVLCKLKTSYNRLEEFSQGTFWQDDSGERSALF
jgi:hypothetical protein